MSRPPKSLLFASLWQIQLPPSFNGPFFFFWNMVQTFWQSPILCLVSWNLRHYWPIGYFLTSIIMALKILIWCLPFVSSIFVWNHSDTFKNTSVRWLEVNRNITSVRGLAQAYLKTCFVSLLSNSSYIGVLICQHWSLRGWALIWAIWSWFWRWRSTSG